MDDLATVSIVTLGCAKNEVDSDAMAQRIGSAGYAMTDDPDQADAIIINTCSFIQAATEESIDAILEAANLPSVASGEAKLIVSGCMVSRYGDELGDEIPEASAFIPCAKEEDIVAILDSLFGRPASGSYCAPTTMGSLPSEHTSYVKISDGCDRFCSYCTIPFIRGRYHSFSYEDIEADVSLRIAQGAREIDLIAQDTGRWGRDLDGSPNLADLMTRLAEAHPEAWFRIMYLQPEGITDELLQAMRDHHNICSYLDIPLQHSDERILKSMNRSGSANAHLALLKRIRSVLPDVALRTTLIVGFPGETEEDFEGLCDFVEEARFDYVGAFAYSREEGTKAHDLPGQIDEDEKLERLSTLRDIADSISAAVISERIGSSTEILLCGTEEDGQLYGRAQSQAPEVDGVTFIDAGQPGSFVTARIVDTLGYEMEGEVCDDRA